MSAPDLRAAIVVAARGWIGTPYLHQASLRGAGCDCLGLVRGVWREVIGPEPEAPPPYTPDWGERTGRETLLDACTRWLLPVERGTARAGDVLLFRWRPDLPIKHAAIKSGADRMVHALEGFAVQDVAIPQAWHRRIAAEFAFPETA